MILERIAQLWRQAKAKGYFQGFCLKPTNVCVVEDAMDFAVRHGLTTTQEATALLEGYNHLPWQETLHFRSDHGMYRLL